MSLSTYSYSHVCGQERRARLGRENATSQLKGKMTPLVTIAAKNATAPQFVFNLIFIISIGSSQFELDSLPLDHKLLAI
jgi:hypothetical protein